MKKTEKNLQLLSMLFGICLVIANVVTGKLIKTGIMLGNTMIAIPGAALCYALTFLITDIIGEIWGRKEANHIVICGFIGQILATLLILLTQYLPAVDSGMQKSYDMLLGQNWIFVIGSLIAYFCSQTWDVWVFHKIRNLYIKNHGDRKGGRWIWNNLSTMSSQIIDTVVFIGISFGLGFKWFFDTELLKVLGAMMLGQYLFKFIIALLDTPFFYIFTRNKEKKII